MKGFWTIFRLELTTLMRSRALPLLTLAGIAWLFAMPHVVTGDGTLDGARELYLRYGLGGVFALVLVSLLATATGTLARERAARRLQLTQVRPVRYFGIVSAKVLALTLAGAGVMGLACALSPLAFRLAPGDSGGEGLARPCNHVYKPLLPSLKEEARDMYETFMKDPETPPEAKKAPKAAVLRLLENRARDHYQTVGTNETAVWRFAPWTSDGRLPSMRFRFSNAYNMRDDVVGDMLGDGLCCAVSNVAQAVIVIPFQASTFGGEPNAFCFTNRGRHAVMLRPRRDVDLLVPADGFGWNLLRAWLEAVAVLMVVLAFGTFLSASLSRPVALFVALAALAVSEMGPSVIEQYPDELETKASDRIGLVLTRFVAEVTRPVAAIAPFERLANDECVEPGETVRVLALDGLAVPVALALLAALILPRKQEDA